MERAKTNNNRSIWTAERRTHDKPASQALCEVIYTPIAGYTRPPSPALDFLSLSLPSHMCSEFA